MQISENPLLQTANLLILPKEQWN